jgi:hypothetical protein
MAVLLQQWGTRMWTYPEILLSPGDSVSVYARDGTASKTIRKSQFAAAVWADAPVSRQLLDHYAGNTILSRLELITLGLQCLHSRETYDYLPGDKAYALMGLLRLHPKIDRSDTAFQAFARLSLANDSDMLLERLICLLPRSDPEKYWEFADAWDAKLWDIYPTCQIAGVGHDDTVIIDGLRAANVRWQSFVRVASTRRATFTRRALLTIWHTAPVAFWTGLIVLATGASSGSKGLIGAGVVFFLYGLTVIAFAPWMVRKLYQGKFWWTQVSSDFAEPFGHFERHY